MLGIIDLDGLGHAERAAEIVLGGGDHDSMIYGQRLQRISSEAMDPRVADVEGVSEASLQHERTERAQVSAIAIVRRVAVSRFTMQPGVRRGDDAEPGRANRPGFRSAVVVEQECLDRRFGGNAADGTGADPVSQRKRHAFQRELAAFWNDRSVKVLVLLLAAFVGALAYRDGESLLRH
jgi:hypothetical protein